jgi:PAS domain S-box-containing protein
VAATGRHRAGSDTAGAVRLDGDDARCVIAWLLETAGRPALLVRLADRRVVDANRRLAELVGLPLADVVARPLGELAELEADGGWDRIVHWLGAQPAIDDVQLRLCTAGGDVRELAASARLVLAGEERCAFILLDDVTQRRDEERRARELDAIVASTEEAIVSTDAEGVIVGWNSAAERLLGYTPEEVVGRPAGVLVPTDRAHEPPAIAERVAAGEAIDRLQTVRLAKSGRRVEVTLRIAPVKDGSGAVIGAATIARPQSEAAERRRLRELAAIVESSEDAILSKDLDGTIRTWNAAAERLYGYCAAEVVGRPVSLLVPPDRPDEIPGILAKLARGEHIEQFQTVRIAKDGRVLDVSLTISPVRLDDGTIVGASTLARDIGERVRAQADSRLLESLLTAAPVPMGMVDRDLRYLRVNEALARLNGRPPAEHVGRTVSEVLPEMAPVLEPLFEEVMCTCRPVIAREVHGVRPGTAGQVGTLLASYFPLIGRRDRVLGVGAVLVDVTDARRAQEALRTSEAARRRLLEQMLHGEDQERARIAGELHDDVIQVMAATLMRLDQLSSRIEHGDSHAAARMVTAARDTLHRATERTRRLTFELRPQLLEGGGLQPALSDLVHLAAREGGFGWDVDVPDVRHPWAIEELVYRTVAEAVSNVRRHASASHLRVIIEERDGELRGEVVDDGCGFDARQALDVRARRLHMGLSAMTERLRLSGGTVDIDSAPGRGTRITFALPTFE